MASVLQVSDFECISWGHFLEEVGDYSVGDYQ